MNYVICALLGYLIGSINPSYFLAQKKGFDIRTKGSGNAGASNALILFGKALGILCAVLDIAKAALAIVLTRALFPDAPLVFPITAAACVLGHIFPFYMHFKGGKGLACLGGIILYFNRRVFLIMLAAEIVIVLITDYICFVPITASLAFPVVYGVMNKDALGALILTVITVVILMKHRENLQRIRQGTELHLSFLWKPKEEIDRIKDQFPQDTALVDAQFGK